MIMTVADMISLLEKFDGAKKVMINDLDGKEWLPVDIHNDYPYHPDVVWIEVE